MNPINWMADKIISSVTTLIGGVVISKVESESLKCQLRSLNELEEAARQFEEEGKVQLAQLMREKISTISTAGPGEGAAAVAESLRENAITFLETEPFVSPAKTISHEPTEKRRRGRPKKVEGSEGAKK